MAEPRTQLPARSAQVRIVLTLLLPALVSLQILHNTTSSTDKSSLVSPDPLPTPQLTVSPSQPVYITGEAVTLTCSADEMSPVSRIQFFKDSQEVNFTQPDSYIHTLPLSPVSRSHTGQYTCQYWKEVSGQETPSKRSQPISIAVTDCPPAPTFTLIPQHQIFIVGESVNLTCSVPSTSTLSGIWFFRDNQRIGSGEYRSSLTGYIGWLQLSRVSQPQAGVYSCEYWKTVSGREIPSQRSQQISINVRAHPPAPKLTVTPQHQIFIVGESVTMTCSVPRTSTSSRIRFFRDSQEIQSTELSWSEANYTDVFQLPSYSGLYTRVYSCEYWKTDSGQEIPSERSQDLFIEVTARPSAPKLTLDSQHQIFIKDESVTLTCSVTNMYTPSGIRFFRDSQIIHSKEFPWSAYDYTDSLQLTGESGLHAGVYSCEYWWTLHGREIPSQSSQPISIAVTDPPGQPKLRVDPPSRMVKEGLPLNITCAVPGNAGEHIFLFYKDGAEILPGHLGSILSSTDPSISSMNTSVLTILKASPNNTGEYTCRYKKNVGGRWILSLGSRVVNITVNIIKTEPFHLRDILLLATGGILLLAGTLASVICCLRKKKRGQKLQYSTKESEGRECTRDLDPSHDNKGLKALGAGAICKEQDSEVTYALVEFSGLEAHTTQSKPKARPAEDEQVLYSELVRKHVQKADK